MSIFHQSNTTFPTNVKFISLDGVLTLNKDMKDTINATHVMETQDNDVRKRIMLIPQIMSLQIFQHFYISLRKQHWGKEKCSHGWWYIIAYNARVLLIKSMPAFAIIVKNTMTFLGYKLYSIHFSTVFCRSFF